MTRRILLMLLALALGLAACSVTKTDLRLDQLDIEGIPAAEVADDITALNARVTGLWSSLIKAKLTTHITKKRIAEYFESEKDLSDFIAIYASLFREKHFAREYVYDFEIGEIAIEPNGVLARVEITIRGRIYWFFLHKIHEVQRWKRIDGVWYIQPETY